MKEVQSLLSRVRQAADRYQMFSPGDRVAVGLSGGKDSGVLLLALAEMRRFYPVSYEVVGVAVDMGFPGADFEASFAPVRRFCVSLDVPFVRVKTDIAKIVFEERREENPCSLCAMLRRGALLGAAKDERCSKLALGHHMDDVVETFMMNLLFDGHIGCFDPVTRYENRNLAVIRPLCATEERLVKQVVSAAGIPVVKSLCPEDGHTQRAAMREYLLAFDKAHRGVYRRIYGAIERGNIGGFHSKK